MPTDPSDLQGLSILGRESKPSKTLEAFPNRTPGRYYRVTLEADEFTCLCPMTGQPDLVNQLILGFLAEIHVDEHHHRS